MLFGRLVCFFSSSVLVLIRMTNIYVYAVKLKTGPIFAFL